MQTVLISGRPHAFHAAGAADASPIVLLHSLGLDRHVFGPLSQLLSASMRVIVPDLIGHGALAAVTDMTTIPDAADQIAALMDHLGISTAAVAGLSMGGAVAQELALRHRGKVNRLALCATMPKGVQAFVDRAEAAERDGLASQIDATLVRWFTPEMVAADTPAVRYARDVLTATDVRKWAGAWRALAAHDAVERVKTLVVPTLCVAGTLDPSTPPALLQSIAALIPGSRYVEIAGGPHLFPLTAAPELAALLSDPLWSAH
ncbi:MAG: alpha/beta fold hydrolase [Bosea sp. (in: a-proteobacteria)]